MTETALTKRAAPSDAELVNQALAREAHLLDTHRYGDWLQMLDPLIRYRVPVPEWVRSRPGSEPGPDEDLAFTYLDETYETLRLRVARLQTGLAHGEMPPSMIARTIGVPLIEPADTYASEDGRLYSVVSTFTLHQTRHEDRIDVFAGRREDLWSVPPAREQLLLRARTVHLIQRTLPRTFSSFF
jgi:3-phenylpropionate/cinnamic acid dioxygenase small subunit